MEQESSINTSSSNSISRSNKTLNTSMAAAVNTTKSSSYPSGILTTVYESSASSTAATAQVQQSQKQKQLTESEHNEEKQQSKRLNDDEEHASRSRASTPKSSGSCSPSSPSSSSSSPSASPRSSILSSQSLRSGKHDAANHQNEEKDDHVADDCDDDDGNESLKDNDDLNQFDDDVDGDGIAERDEMAINCEEEERDNRSGVVDDDDEHDENSNNLHHHDDHNDTTNKYHDDDHDELDDDDEDRISVYSKRSFDKIKQTISEDTVKAIKMCFETDPAGHLNLHNHRHHHLNGLITDDMNGVVVGESKEQDDQVEDVTMSASRRCAENDADRSGTGRVGIHINRHELVALKTSLIMSINRVIQTTLESFYTTKLKSMTNSMGKFNQKFIYVQKNISLDIK